MKTINKKTAQGAKIVSAFGVAFVCAVISCKIQEGILMEVGGIFSKVIDFINERSK